MKSYQILPHVADIRLKVEADNLTELFMAAIEGMMTIIKESKAEEQEREKRIIEVESADATSLLIDFMNDILYQSHTNKEVYTEVNFLEFSEKALKAEIYGIKVDDFDEDIKAVTYHEAEIKKNEKGNFETVIVFDI